VGDDLNNAAGGLPHGSGKSVISANPRYVSLHPISDKAEVSVDFPDKAYIGSFGRHSQFDAYADDDSVAVRLVRPREDRREAVMHLHQGSWRTFLSSLLNRWPLAVSSTSSTAPS
jgi:hypothetical protein